MMDLGFFPTGDEIRLMHHTLGSTDQERKRRLVSGDFKAGASIQEFLDMVTVLSLKTLPPSTVATLHDLFTQYCGDEGWLLREDLGGLMRALGHPEDEVLRL